MNNWKYKNKRIYTIDDTPKCCPWIVYKIEFPSGHYYFGSKQLYFSKKVKLSKKRSLELWSGKGRKPTKEVKVTESDWKTYNSSSKIVQEKITRGEKPTFVIIDFFADKRDMLLYEAKLIINEFLAKDPKILNSWVNVKMFKDKIV